MNLQYHFPGILDVTRAYRDCDLHNTCISQRLAAACFSTATYLKVLNLNRCGNCNSSTPFLMIPTNIEIYLYPETGICKLNALFCISVESLFQFHTDFKSIGNLISNGEILYLLFIINDRL